MTYRVIAIVGGALTLVGCSTGSDLMGSLKPGPTMDTVSFESEPPGAEAKASNGQTCRTPCSLALPVEATSTVTFTLNGYLPESEKLDSIQQTGEPPRLQPNPVVVELSPAPATQKPAKKPAKKPAAKKQAARQQPVTAAAPAASPTAAAPAQAASPWPATPPSVRQ